MTENQLFDQLIKKNSTNNKFLYIGRLLQRAAHNHPQQTALLCEQEFINFLQLYERASALSSWLINNGIKPRDRVIVYIYNSIEFYVAYYAVLQVGAVVVPLNIFLKERELEHIMNDSQCSLIIASRDLIERVKKVNGSHQLPLILAAEEISSIAKVANQAQQFEPIELDDHEMAVLLYTSGTTGLPKGVMISSYNAIINTMQGITRFKPNQQDRMLAALPLFHSFAQNTYVWLPFFLGITVIIVPRIERRFILSAIENHKPTIIAAVPAFYGLLCLFKTVPLESVRIFISGGDALPDKIRAAFELLYRRKLISGYGMTETSPFVSGSFEDEAVINTCVGKPLVAIEYAIRDEQGNELSKGTVGQLWLKGPNVMLGYYNAPEMTNEVIRNGWLSTGDLAYVDEKERFVITGRYKDLIKHKGFNIYPQEVENVLLLHPNVIRAAVIGIAEDQFGEIPVAYVQLREKQENIDQVLKDLCIKNLADYKVPKKFIATVEDLPTTATGKVDKKALRALYEKN